MRKILFILLILGGAGALFAALVYVATHPSVQIAGSNSGVSTSSAQDSTPQQTGREVPAGEKEYARQNYHFSILYPDTVVLKEQGGSSDQPLFLVFQDSAQEHRGFQLFAKPYPSQTITQETFKLDEPSGIIKNQQNISVAGGKGIMFESSDPTVGVLREIWFIKNGILYEVTTAKEFDSWIQGILNTWQFI